METIVERCAFLDVHRDTVMACARTPDGSGGRREEVSQFAHDDVAVVVAGGLARRAAGHAGRDGSHGRVLETGSLGPGRRGRSRCGSSTRVTCVTSRAARPMSRMRSGGRSCSSMGWCARRSSHPSRSGSCGT